MYIAYSFRMPTGKGYADVVFLPRRGTDRPTLIVELKYGKSAGGAIEQIKKRNYADGLKGGGGEDSNASVIYFNSSPCIVGLESQTLSKKISNLFFS